MSLSLDEVFRLIDSIDSEEISYYRVRSHNQKDIRTTTSMLKNELKVFIARAVEESHQPGGDIEVFIPAINQTLVGHHDGIYWLRPSQTDK